jgi:hypothetical protein
MGETTTLDEGHPSRGSKHSGVAALKKKEKNETRRKGEEEVVRHFLFAEATKYFLTFCFAYL